jgi:hypothetical protein
MRLLQTPMPLWSMNLTTVSAAGDWQPTGGKAASD